MRDGSSVRQHPVTAEEEVRETDLLAAQTLDALGIGTWHLDVDSGEFRASDRALALHGLRDVRLDGRTALEPVDPEDRALVQAALVGAIRDGRSYLVEFRSTQADGTVRWLRSEANVVAGPRGRRLLGIVRDVTEQRALEARLRAFVASDVIGILFGDVDGRVYDCNEELARIVGRTREDVLAGRVSWRDITPPEDLPLDEAAIAEARATGRCRPYEKRYVRPDGSRVDVQVGYALLEPDRRRSVAFVLDVSARKAAEAALREADRRKTEFLSVLSHELRNPLNAIRNGVTLLERAPAGGEASRRARDVIDRQARQLERLVDDLLDVSRIVHGKTEIRLARIDAREAARRAHADAAEAFAARDVALALAEPPEPLWVDADAGRLAQMLGNLLGNALKFTPRGGRVTLAVERRGGACELSVSDTGPGLDAAELERVFLPFFQAERAGAGHGGLGLGLALVRELAARHGGGVRAESPGPGHGAKFTVRLPLADASGQDRLPAAAG